MTDKEKEIIGRKLSEILPNIECPMCHNRHFTILDRYVVSPVQDDYKANTGLIQKTIPALTIVCTKCGFMSQHSLGILGLFETRDIFTVNGVSFIMIRVEGGTFMMGTTSEQGSEAFNDEKTAPQVTLSDYYIGETQVTQELWQAVMGSNPSHFKGANRPVENVSWYDCQDFIIRLNKLTGKHFRLPTEAEWEFAARGGKKGNGCRYAGSNHIDDVAWYEGNSGNETHPVGQKQSNELGLYDMSGNVWEWCQDWYGDYSSNAQTTPTGPGSGSYRVARGGSWRYGAGYCRSSIRSGIAPSSSCNYLGLRLAL